MREMTIEHDGKTYTLAATFAASVKLADRVEDPLKIAREAALEAAMMKARMPYTPKFDFTVRNVPVILHIGMEAAGASTTIEEVQELVFSKGLVHARLWAADYVALIVEPKPAKPEVEPEDEVAGSTPAGNGKGSKAGAAA
jgi:hypothetical protein